MKIDKEKVREVAVLARLELSDAELEKCAADLSRVLEYVEQIDAMGLEETTPLLQVNARHPEARADGENEQTLARDVVLEQAPDSDGEFFLVPPVVLYPES